MAYIASHLKTGITHQQRVMRLYRNSLKHLLSWCIEREVWREEALILRDRFDKYKNETNQQKIQKLLEGAEAEFESKKHPYPYINPTSPDGSKWERNIPPPPHLGIGESGGYLPRCFTAWFFTCYHGKRSGTKRCVIGQMAKIDPTTG